jgi:hypothetical protein
VNRENTLLEQLKNDLEQFEKYGPDHKTFKYPYIRDTLEEVIEALSKESTKNQQLKQLTWLSNIETHRNELLEQTSRLQREVDNLKHCSELLDFYKILEERQHNKLVQIESTFKSIKKWLDKDTTHDIKHNHIRALVGMKKY